MNITKIYRQPAVMAMTISIDGNEKIDDTFPLRNAVTKNIFMKSITFLLFLEFEI